ncbi:MAG: AAA family ATPase [Clostridia bacterium]|nr:AAA family ATPase [Clostridia bacterium]
MQYLQSFTLPTLRQEDKFLLNFPHQLEMQCYDPNNVYPFRIFPEKQFSHIDFSPITIFCGGNGSGKSTLLNVIAEKLNLSRTAPFNTSPVLEDYLDRCCAVLPEDSLGIPKTSCIITSDDVFDYLLDIRAFNRGVVRRREALFSEYDELTDPTRPAYQMRSLDDYDELKRHNEARRQTKSVYTARRLPMHELAGKSNGESAFAYFTHHIGENALYLLDEPENSLSAPLQQELARFITDSARFYGCQFIISTHSPFLLAMHDTRIYDLDSTPVCVRPWQQLTGMQAYRALFTDSESSHG